MKRLIVLFILLFTTGLSAQEERTQNLIERIKTRFAELDKVHIEQTTKALEKMLQWIEQDSALDARCRKYLLRKLEK